MATCQSETVNSVPQASEADFHVRAFRRFSEKALRCANLNGYESDADASAALEEATDAFECMMNAPAGSLPAVILKAKAAAIECYRSSESVASGRIYGELFAMLALELETILAMETRGKAVQS